MPCEASVVKGPETNVTACSRNSQVPVGSRQADLLPGCFLSNQTQVPHFCAKCLPWSLRTFSTNGCRGRRGGVCGHLPEPPVTPPRPLAPPLSLRSRNVAKETSA